MSNFAHIAALPHFHVRPTSLTIESALKHIKAAVFGSSKSSALEPFQISPAVVESALPLDGGTEQSEGGPGFFRCLLVCGMTSLTCYGAAAWLIF